ncbi:hypothetical protein Tco_1236654 [Tanacetum coccineum]
MIPSMPEPIQPMPTITRTAFSRTCYVSPLNILILHNNPTEKEKYEIWAMKMEYWIQNADHNLWRIVQQGNSPKRLGKDAKGNTIIHPPVSLDEHVGCTKRKNKSRQVLGNEDSKKMKKTMLKHHFARICLLTEEKAYIRVMTEFSEDSESVESSFEKNAGRMMNNNNQQSLPNLNRRKVKSYKCLQLGHFARECNVKTVDAKAQTLLRRRLKPLYTNVGPRLGNAYVPTYLSLELICPSPYQSDIEETQLEESDSAASKKQTSSPFLLVVKDFASISSCRSSELLASKTDPSVPFQLVQPNHAGWSKKTTKLFHCITRGRWDTAVKTSARQAQVRIAWVHQYRNKEKLADFVPIKGGIVKFGGGDGRISGKGTIRTSKLDFENVYYVEELQHFNLFLICSGLFIKQFPRIMERNADYAEELAKLQRQEYEAKDAAARYDPAALNSAVKDFCCVDSAVRT